MADPAQKQRELIADKAALDAGVAQALLDNGVDPTTEREQVIARLAHMDDGDYLQLVEDIQSLELDELSPRRSRADTLTIVNEVSGNVWRDALEPIVARAEEMMRRDVPTAQRQLRLGDDAGFTETFERLRDEVQDIVAEMRDGRNRAKEAIESLIEEQGNMFDARERRRIVTTTSDNLYIPQIVADAIEAPKHLKSTQNDVSPIHPAASSRPSPGR